MAKKKDRDNPSPDKQSQSFKQHYAGTSIAKREMQKHDPVEHTAKPTQTSAEKNPLEVVMGWWEFIKDPKHSQAVIAILTLVLASTSIGYVIVASCQLSVMSRTLDLERPWVGPASGGDASRLLIDPNTKFLAGVDWRYQNGGRSPAIHVMSALKFEIGPRASDVTEKTLPHAIECDQEPSMGQGGILLVPSIFAPSSTAWVPDKIKPVMSDVYLDKVGLYLIGCVYYTDTEMKKWYKTDVTEVLHVGDRLYFELTKWGNNAR